MPAPVPGFFEGVKNPLLHVFMQNLFLIHMITVLRNHVAGREARASDGQHASACTL